MRVLVAAALLLTAGLGYARGEPPEFVWLSLDTHGYHLLQRIDPGIQTWVTRPAPTRKSAERRTLPARTLYVVRVSTAERNSLARAMHRDQAHPVGFIGYATLVDALASLSPSLLGFEPTRPEYRIDQQATILPLLADVSATRIGADIQSLTSFHNRFYRSSGGIQSADWLADEWGAMTAGRSDVEIEKVYRDIGAMPSVVLRIEGTTLPDQVLVLGAHLDSVNWRDRNAPLGERRAPGADDDASGIADITEVLRVLMRHHFHPARSIHFIAYAGEELGLYGSMYIAANYAARQVNVIGVLQLDMTNYRGSSDDIYLIDDGTDAQQNAFVAELVHYYLPDLTVGHTVCGYGCSDHVSWTQHGYAASFPFEARVGEDDPWIHSSGDTWAHCGSQAVHARKFARLALAWAVELAGSSPRACRKPRATGPHLGLVPRRGGPTGGQRAPDPGGATLRATGNAGVKRCLPGIPMRPVRHDR